MRESSLLPSLDQQAEAVSHAACDELKVERGSETASERRVHQFIRSLGKNDEVIVAALGVLGRTSGRCAVAIRQLFEQGAFVTVFDARGVSVTFRGEREALELALLLAGYETAIPSRPLVRGPAAEKPEPETLQLSKYQLAYARKLYAQGESLRSIGLLFRAPPTQLWRALAQGDAPGADEPPAASVG